MKLISIHGDQLEVLKTKLSVLKNLLLNPGWFTGSQIQLKHWSLIYQGTTLKTLLLRKQSSQITYREYGNCSSQAKCDLSPV
jgi:hypothetical protein